MKEAGNPVCPNFSLISQCLSVRVSKAIPYARNEPAESGEPQADQV